MPRLALSTLLAFAMVSAGAATAQQPDAAAVLRQLALPLEAQLATDRQLVLPPPPKPEAEVPAATVQQAAARLAAAVAVEHRTIDQIVAAADGKVDGVFAFVRDHIGTAVYPGVLRGAQGTLDSRCGNAADKALLLTALLASAGFETRFVRGDLPPERVAMLVARQFDAVPPAPADLVPGWSNERFATALAQRARRDHAAVRPALGDPSAAVGEVLAAAAARNAGLAARHIWVQVNDGREWHDLDANFAAATVGQRFTDPAATMAQLPDTDYQRLTVRVVAEMLAGGAVTRSNALESSHTVVALADRDVTLLHLPAGSTGAVGDLIASKRKGDYAPALVVAGRLEIGQGVAFLPSIGGGNFGDLAGGLTGGSAEPPVLVGEWLEFEIAVPGLPVQKIVRSLIDRVPPALRAAGRVSKDNLLPLELDGEGRPLAARALHNVLISSGAHDLAELARSLATQAGAADRNDLFTFCSRMALCNRQWQVIADSVVVAALNDHPAVRAVHAAPRVFVMTMGATDSGDVFLRSDLMLQDVALVARDESAWPLAAARRLWHGVLEGALEHEFVASRLGSVSAEPQLISASAGLEAESPLVLRPGDAEALTTATQDADLLARLRSALASGSTLVIPRSTLAVGRSCEDATWWQLTANGTLRAVLGADYGGAVSNLAMKGSSRPGPNPFPRPGPGGPVPPRPPGSPDSNSRSGTEWLILIAAVTLAALDIGIVLYDINQFIKLWDSF